jgi:serine/threonine protein kinase
LVPRAILYREPPPADSMPPGRSPSNDPFEGDPPADPSLERSLGSLRALASGEFEVLGPLGRDPRGGYAFLARDLSRDRLVVLKHRRSDSAGPRGQLEVIPQLDSSVPPPAGSCPVCHAPFTSWEPACTECGVNVAGSGFAASGTSLAEVLARVREAAHGYEVLGTMARAVGGEPVFFAREFSGGDLVALLLEPEVGPDRRPGYAITATRMMRPKLLYGTVGGERDYGATGGSANRPWTPIPSPPIAMPAGDMSGPGGPAKSSDGEKVCPECRGTFGAELRFCPRDGSVLRSPDTAEELVGRVIAERYRIVRKLGQGGMGTVYLAEHIRMGRRCAIKVMNPVLLHDPDAINRFSREASNASRMSHAHVAAIYDFGETSDGIVYLAMEFVEGESLGAVLDRKRVLREQRAIEIGSQVADALSAAHELGIVHRDLKPDNIMVCHSKGKPHVKVVDFGIAKATQGGSQTVTRTGYVVGTPAYMSPEQILGDPLDGRSDLYSLGCILYEMLTGERAFAGPSGEVSLRRRLTEPPPRPRKIKRTLSKSLDTVVTKAMARSPEDRFQSAGDMRDALMEATKESGPRPGLRGWLSRSGPQEVDTADHDSVPAAQAFSPPPRLTPPGFPADAGAMDWNQGAPPAHYSGGRTTVIRHRSARREGWHPGRVFGGTAMVVLLGFLAWFVPIWSWQEPESSSGSVGQKAGLEATDDTTVTVNEKTDSLLIGTPGTDGSEPLPPPPPIGGDSTRDSTPDSTPAAGAPAVVRFEKSLPPGARVTIDGTEAPLTLDGYISLEPGSRLVRVRAPGFRSASRRLSVAAGDTASLPLELVKIDPDSAALSDDSTSGVGPGAIVISGKLPAGTEIRVDGWPLALGGRVASVDSGAHWVTFAAPEHQPDSSSVHVGAGARVVLRVPKLAKLPPQSAEAAETVPPAPVSPSPVDSAAAAAEPEK